MGRELGLQHRNVNSGKADGRSETPFGSKQHTAHTQGSTPLAHLAEPGWMKRSGGSRGSPPACGYK